jgi:hypothetical protein
MEGSKAREGGKDVCHRAAGLLCGWLLCEFQLFFTLGIIAFWVGIEGERLLLMDRVDVTSNPYVGVDEGGEAGR